MDSRKRSVLKTCTYRAVAMATTATIAWAVTGSAHFAASIGVFDALVKLGGYYVHERLWNRTSFGQQVASHSPLP